MNGVNTLIGHRKGIFSHFYFLRSVILSLFSPPPLQHYFFIPQKFSSVKNFQCLFRPNSTPQAANIPTLTASTPDKPVNPPLVKKSSSNVGLRSLGASPMEENYGMGGFEPERGSRGSLNDTKPRRTRFLQRQQVSYSVSFKTQQMGGTSFGGFNG